MPAELFFLGGMYRIRKYVKKPIFFEMRPAVLRICQTHFPPNMRPAAKLASLRAAGRFLHGSGVAVRSVNSSTPSAMAVSRGLPAYAATVPNSKNQTY